MPSVRQVLIAKFFISVLFILGATRICAEEVTLVKDGRCVSEIVLGDNPTRTAQFAAYELQYAVRLITGAELPIVNDGKDSAAVSLFVGSQGKKREWHREEYRISFEKDGIHLEGNDNDDYGKVDYNDHKTFPPLAYYYKSTLYAVYDFLEKGCGVRYYSFGEKGVAFTPRRTLSVESFSLQRTPKMEAFRRVYYGSAKRVSQRDSLLLRHRWRENYMYGLTNHNIYSIYYRYWDKAASPQLAKVFIERHPEYFAQNQAYKDNSAIQKYQYPNQQVPSQLCYSSDGPVQYFAEEANKFYKGEPVPGAILSEIKPMPGMPFYYAILPDDNNNVCRCDKCLKVRETYTLSDYYFDWVNRIAKAAKKLNPEINFSTLSYGISIESPEHVKIEPGIAIQLPVSFQSWFHPLVYKRQHDNYKKWLNLEKENRPLTTWIYLLNPQSEAIRIHKYNKFFPVLYPEHAGEYFTEFVNDGLRGFFAETSIEQHELEGYIIARLAYDPSVGYHELIDEYYKQYFGGAGAAMRDVYETLEKIGFNPNSYRKQIMEKNFRGSYIYGIHNEIDNWHLGTPERMKLIRGLLDKALEEASSPVEKLRVEDFIDRVWKQAEEGRVEFEKRELVRNIPPPRFFIPCNVTELGGDLGKVDFSTAFKFNSWVDAYNKKSIAGDLRIAADNTHLYVEYAEKDPETAKNKDAQFWTNGLELFLANVIDGDYRQIFADPNGKIEAYTSYTVNGANHFDKMDMKIVAENQLDTDAWRIRMALPLKELGLPDEKATVFANFIRTRNYDKNQSSAYFSPIFCDSHALGLYRLGSLILLEKAPLEQTLDVNGAFRNTKGKKLPDGWEENKACPGDVRFENGAITLKSSDKNYCHVFYNEIFRANPGDKVIFEYTASGKGHNGCGLYLFHGKGYNFNKAILQGKPGTETAQRQRMELTIPDCGTFHYPTTHFRAALIVGGNSEMTVSDISVTVKNNK